MDVVGSSQLCPNSLPLKSPDITASYRRYLANNLSSALTHPLHNTAESAWANLSSAIQKAASDTIGFTSKRHQDCLDDSSLEILNLLEEKHKALSAHLSNPQSPSLRSNWSNIRAECLPKLPPVHELDDPPRFSEVLAAVRSLKDNKSTGPDGIPAEALKKGGYLLTKNLHQLIQIIWAQKTVPQGWKDSHIVTIHKKKGDKSICGNSRGISLLSVAGKVLTRVMLFRLTKHITERILPESQGGFRKDRPTSDMIFVLRQLQEKAREQNKDLFIAFIDLAKAFDTIDRQVLWVILEKFGVPPRFLEILQQFHDGMQACVIVGTSRSPSFPVQVGVKQGCVLAPVIFNLFLAAVTLLSRNSLSPDDGVCLQFRLDGNLFNLRRLQAITKTTTTTIHELQYADDCALVAHSPTAMQHTLDVVCAVYQACGLQVNIKKTEIIAQTMVPTLTPPEFFIHGTPVKVVQHFCYLESILTPTCLIDNEIQARINLASSAFGRLRSRVFVNKDLRTFTKAAVYQAVCISTLLFGAEAWTPYRRHIRCLEGFHIRCLQRILGVT
ncbi:unnamed protein product [Leuciscus chuanchicus]